MKYISTFSQQLRSSEYDLYLVDEVVLDPGNQERENIYAQVCKILDDGKKVYQGINIETWQLNDDTLFIVHTDSRDLSGRVIDVMLLISCFSQFEQVRILMNIVTRIENHISSASLICNANLEIEINDALDKLEKEAKKSWIVKLIEWFVSVIKRFMGIVVIKNK